MRECPLSPDEDKECACLVKKGIAYVCDVYDERPKNMKICLFEERKKK